jgi:predicted metal-dependent phosphoesterase TrpH
MRVIFRKPKFKKLDRDYNYVDMHFHSKYSDGINTVKTILKKAKRIGIGVAITDHHDIRTSMLALRDKSSFIIPGIEITSDEGMHILFYFYDPEDLRDFYVKYIQKYRRRNPIAFIRKGIYEILDNARNYDCLVCPAHPFGIAWTGICKYAHKDYLNKKVLKQIDAVEVMNGVTSRKANIKALKFANRFNKGLTGGSDGHTLVELGNVLTFATEKTVPGFLNAIRSHESFVIGKETMILHRGASQFVKIKGPIKDPITPLKKGLSYMRKREYKINRVIKKIIKPDKQGYKATRDRKFFRI